MKKVIESALVTCAVSAFCATSALAQDCPELVGRWSYGPAYAVAVVGDTAFIGTGAVLQVVDVSDAAAPALVGELQLPRLVSYVAASGSHAYVVDGWDVLHVVDVSSPAAPIKVGEYIDPDGAWFRDVDLDGDRLYLSGLRLRILDVSDPATPTLIGDWSVEGVHAGPASIQGTYAYVVTWGNEPQPDHLRIVDIADPASPFEVGLLPTPGNGDYIAASGSSVFVAVDDGTMVLDVSNPTNPVEVGWIPESGDLAAQASTLALVSGGILRLFDVANPTVPTGVGQLDLPYVSKDLVFVPNRVFLAAANDGLRVIDVSDPTIPAEEGYFVTAGGFSMSSVLVGDYALVGQISQDGPGEYGRLRVLDASDPVDPTLVATLTVPLDMGVYSMTVSGGLAYAGTSRGLWVVDVSDPVVPHEVSYLALFSTVEDVVVCGEYAYLATSSTPGLHIVDVSNPQSPLLVGDEGAGGAFSYGVDVMGDYAVVASSGWLRVLDISNPAEPTEIASTQTLDNAQGVDVHGPFAFVADFIAGMSVFDVSDPMNPNHVSTVDGYGWGPIQDVRVTDDGYAFLAGEELIVIDVEDPDSPTVVGEYLPYGADITFNIDVDPARGLAALAGGRTGIRFFDVSSCLVRVFSDGFESGDTSAWSATAP